MPLYFISLQACSLEVAPSLDQAEAQRFYQQVVSWPNQWRSTFPPRPNFPIKAKKIVWSPNQQWYFWWRIFFALTHHRPGFRKGNLFSRRTLLKLEKNMPWKCLPPASPGPSRQRRRPVRLGPPGRDHQCGPCQGSHRKQERGEDTDRSGKKRK